MECSSTLFTFDKLEDSWSSHAAPIRSAINSSSIFGRYISQVKHKSPPDPIEASD